MLWLFVQIVGDGCKRYNIYLYVLLLKCTDMQVLLSLKENLHHTIYELNKIESRHDSKFNS